MEWKKKLNNIVGKIEDWIKKYKIKINQKILKYCWNFAKMREIVETGRNWMIIKGA